MSQGDRYTQVPLYNSVSYSMLFLKRKSSVIPDDATVDTKEDKEALTIP